MSASETPTVLQRIQSYLENGGLFNPELANHDRVRELIMDCRNELTAALAEAEGFKKDAERYRWIRLTYYSTGHRSGGNLPECEYITFDIPDGFSTIDAAIDASRKP